MPVTVIVAGSTGGGVQTALDVAEGMELSGIVADRSIRISCAVGSWFATKRLAAEAGTAPNIIGTIVAAADASAAFIPLAQPVVRPACRRRYRVGNHSIAVPAPVPLP